MSILEDLRFGLRTLAKSPGFTLVAITALALGIGVNATVFSLSNAVLFKNLPFANSDQILYIVSTNATRPHSNRGFSFPNFRDLRAAVKSFDAVGAATEVSANISDHTASPEGYHGARVTANTFSVIGQKPVAGRDFLPADEQPGAAPVAILSYKVWENRYGKDLSVVGRTVRIDEEPTTIIGVMPTRLDFPRETEVWKPLILKDEYEKRENRRFTVFGHLAPHANLKSANAEVSTIARRLATEYPIQNKDIGARVIDYNEYFAGSENEIRIVFTAMLGAVGFVLLIACANVANLQLGRAVSRMREISIRVALGAGRWRIIRQLLVESLILSIAGGLIGWMIAIWGVRTFDNAVIPFGKPQSLDFSMDVRALVYLAVITIGTGLLFGLAPALRLSKLDVNNALKDGGRGSSGGGRGKYLSGLLVVVEMALAVVLLAGAGLMIRSFMNAYRSDLGIRNDNILTMWIQLPNANYLKPEQQLAFFDRLKTRIDGLPGVEASTVTSNMPLTGSWDFPYEIEGEPQPDARRRPNVDAVITTPDYFRVMGDQILAGRDFTAADGLPSSLTVLVNRQFAQSILRDENPLGRRLRLYKKDVAQPWLTIVGVVPNLPYNNQRDAARPDHLSSLSPRNHLQHVRRRPNLGPPVDSQTGLSPRGRGHRRRSARPQPAYDGRASGAAKLALSRLRQPVRHLRRHRPGARLGRTLRRHRPLGQPAYPGNRRPHGARRDRQQRPPSRLQTGHDAARHRTRHWPRRCPRRYESPEGPPGRRLAVRPADLRHNRARADPRRRRRLPDPRPPSHARRPH